LRAGQLRQGRLDRSGDQGHGHGPTKWGTFGFVKHIYIYEIMIIKIIIVINIIIVILLFIYIYTHTVYAHTYITISIAITIIITWHFIALHTYIRTYVHMLHYITFACTFTIFYHYHNHDHFHYHTLHYINIYIHT
jgi:hypothetical protein